MPTLLALKLTVRYRESLEVYIMSASNDENNTKVRGGLMDSIVLRVLDVIPSEND